MSGRGYTVPYHDPHSSPINFEYFDFMFDSNPTLASLSSMEEQQEQGREGEPPSSSVDLFVDDIMEPNDPFADPMIWNNNNDINNANGSNYATQPQEVGTSTQNYRNPDHARSQWSNDGIGIPITVWPPPLAPYKCTCCQVLREIIHTNNGNCTSKLEIHGRLGMICHAVLEIKDQVIEGSPVSQYHMVDFCKKSIVYVKQFLRQYCEDQKRAGFVLVQDPLSIFYEALCVGIEWDESTNNDEFSDPFPSTWSRQGDLTGGEIVPEKVTKTSLAQQRIRTGKLTIEDLRAYFDLPIEAAARRLNLCPTVVKKICRRYGINRWPHRKIKSIKRKMADLRPLVDSNDQQEKARAAAEIHRLQKEISQICNVTDN